MKFRQVELSPSKSAGIGGSGSGVAFAACHVEGITQTFLHVVYISYARLERVQHKDVRDVFAGHDLMEHR